jgi:hypothetical protein
MQMTCVYKYVVKSLFVLLAFVCISQVLVGCGGAANTVTANSEPTPTTNQSSITSGPPPTGPTDFVLNNQLNFSRATGTGMVNGTTRQLDASTVENGVIETFKHTLFVRDASDNISVYPDGATSPVAAQVSRNGDGSTLIEYTTSSRTGTTHFRGVLAASQMMATYEADFMGGTTVNHQSFTGGTDSSSAFSTLVHWVSPDQIPASPRNGHYQLTSNGGVALAWTAGSGRTPKYNIYRMILAVDHGFVYLAQTNTNSYTDNSQAAIANARSITGIAYAIYAVGPAGVENPGDVVISVSALG